MYLLIRKNEDFPKGINRRRQNQGEGEEAYSSEILWGGGFKLTALSDLKRAPLPDGVFYAIILLS